MAVSAGALVKAREGLYKVLYYETETWGSTGDGLYVTGGAPVTISQFKRITAALPIGLFSGRGITLEANPIGANTNQVTLRAYGASGDEIPAALEISGIKKVALLVFGE